MVLEPKAIEQEALNLPLEDRAQLAQKLLLSLDTLSEEERDDVWMTKASRRAHELDRGEVQSVPAGEVRRKTRTPLGMNEMKERKPTAKWGFGMAPISWRMQRRYDVAVQTVLDLLDGNIEPQEVTLNNLSELKGMFNRCLRQDQWDWFSVFAEFGGPPHKHIRQIVNNLQVLRRSLIANDHESAESAKWRLIDNNLLQYLDNYQSELNLRSGSDDAGWVYILSTREQPSILKIGMTRRSVFQRVKEINSATGVLIPLSARRVFRVKHATDAEREIFELLSRYRIRPDREFFEMPFAQAASLIDEYLEKCRMRDRQRGKVVWFNHEKRYGFIATTENKDVYVHSSQVTGSALFTLQPGTSVEFDLGRRPKGPCAFRVRVLQDTI